jgi:hypothetical protein
MSARHRLHPLFRSRGAMSLLLGPFLTACVSSQHHFAGQTSPPVLLHIAAAQPPIEAALHAVIVYQGPGTWKRNAYWDEYVLTVANRGDAPLTIESAALIAFSGNAVSPGDDPWALEESSRTWWQSNARVAGAVLGVGAGSVAFGGMEIAAALGSMGAAGASAGLALLPLAAPAFIAVSVALDEDRKDQIEAEFARRRLVLPARIPTGQNANGSLFFRIVPGPRQLVFRCGTAGQLQVITLDLAPIASLHLKRSAPNSVARVTTIR